MDDGKHLIWYDPLTIFETPIFEDVNERNCSTGYQLYKSHSGDYTEGSLATTSTGQIYFRFGETLLIYAEAKAELGTITQSDLEKTVNALRKRIGMTNGLVDLGGITIDPNWEFSNLSPILQEIRRERKIELACEGFRVDDIFRWAAADELIKNKKPLGAKQQQWINYPGASSAFLTAVADLPVTVNGYIDPYANFVVGATGYQFNINRDYLLPIPTTELTLNSNLVQNPGW